MSDDKQVNQPQNDVQEAEVKQTQSDEKPTPTFNQEDVDRIVKQRLEAEKSKHQRMLDEAKKQEQELAKEKEIQEAKTKADLENLMKQRIADKDKELADTTCLHQYREFVKYISPGGGNRHFALTTEIRTTPHFSPYQQQQLPFSYSINTHQYLSTSLGCSTFYSTVYFSIPHIYGY